MDLKLVSMRLQDIYPSYILIYYMNIDHKCIYINVNIEKSSMETSIPVFLYWAWPFRAFTLELVCLIQICCWCSNHFWNCLQSRVIESQICNILIMLGVSLSALIPLNCVFYSSNCSKWFLTISTNEIHPQTMKFCH